MGNLCSEEQESDDEEDQRHLESRSLIHAKLKSANGRRHLKETNSHTGSVAVAITAPHAYCPDVILQHECDKLSGPAAIALSNAMKQYNEAITRLFVSQTFRPNIDLNRAQGANADFRPALRDFMSSAEAKQHPIAVIDVHSFAPGYRGRSVWHDEIADRSEIVFLDMDGNSSWFVDSLQSTGVQATGLTGHPTINDICKEARERGAELTLLLEFNEGLSQTRLHHITQALARLIVVFLQKRTSSQEQHHMNRANDHSDTGELDRHRLGTPHKHNGDHQNAIVAPTPGTVEGIHFVSTEDLHQQCINIYLAPEDSHTLYAPVTGTLVDTDARDGSLVGSGTRFVVPLGHTGALTLFWRRESDRVSIVTTYTVGKPAYITDLIKLTASVGQRYRAGDEIGEIVIGSRAQICVPAAAQVNVRKGGRLRGGKTVVAVLREASV